MVTSAGERAPHDPHAPQLIFRLEGLEDSPGHNLFNAGATFKTFENCSIDELVGSNYSEVFEWLGDQWWEIPIAVVRKYRVGGWVTPIEFPSSVEEVVLDMPTSNPEIFIAAVDGDS